VKALVCAVAAVVVASAAHARQSDAAAGGFRDGFRIETLSAGAGEKALLAADLDGDGALDLAVAAQEQDRVLVFRGDGRGGFGAPTASPAGEAPNGLASADFDADGRADLAAANHEARYLTVLLGAEDARFRPAPGAPVSIATQPHSHMIAATDIDGDGVVDLVVDSRDRQAVVVLRGLGGGAFDAPGIDVNVGGTPYLGFALGDLDGDGRSDLAAPNANDIGVLMNRSSDAIAFELVQAVRASAPFAVALADLDGDGAPEIVAASEGAGITMFARSTGGAFEQRESFQARAGAKSVAVGDFDGDGFDDAAVASWSGELLVLYGGAEGASAVPLPLGAIVAPWGLAAGDLDGDGRDDLAVADAAGETINVYRRAGD
jgi:hypothetical protein